MLAILREHGRGGVVANDRGFRPTFCYREDSMAAATPHVGECVRGRLGKEVIEYPGSVSASRCRVGSPLLVCLDPEAVSVECAVVGVGHAWLARLVE